MKLGRYSKRCQHFLHQLFYSLLFAPSVLLAAAPVHATKLESWRFNASQNQLELFTDEGIQPKAQLVSDPTRLVIDLPGVMLGRSVVKETYDGVVQSVRVGQFDRDTTRVVIELAPGYTLDPSQIKFRGISAQQWVVSLPKPQPIAGNSGGYPTSRQSNNQANSASSSQPNSGNGSSAIVVQSHNLMAVSSQPAAPALPERSALIEAIEVDASNQLIVRANQPIRYTSRWERGTGELRIEIPGAQFVNKVQGPQLSADSPFQRIRLRQETPQLATILIRPSGGTQLGQVNQINPRVLALSAQRSPQSRITSSQTSQTPIPAWKPAAPTISPIPKGQVVVIIDPGHGGPDPGAVGIGGLQEKGIVLDIGRQVAGLLQQRGVYALLTRGDDRDLDLEPRVQMAEQANATVFVSIHANAISLSRPEVSGLETYYYQSGADLAQVIHQSILQSTGVSDRGVRTARFYVLRRTSMPSVLVEVGFVTGQEDAMRLSNPSYRAQMADAIARGILQYLQRTARL
ncbi:MAG: N-acetylmuramoyl-L-alanine amidase [Leptolyngbyaceae cyanobacterium bins.302]|nr:N-acetylmuramoyl-L-alanine amidase [Leptolyngbyaceae cyanobacterium bins.302]